MVYDLSALDIRLRAVPAMLPKLEAHTTRAPGGLLRCWEHELGILAGRVTMLRGFEDPSSSRQNATASCTVRIPWGLGHLRNRDRRSRLDRRRACGRGRRRTSTRYAS